MFLADDPRPELKRDSHLWRRLFRVIPKLIFPVDPIKSEALSKMMWQLRAWGVEMRWSTSGTRMSIGGESAFEDLDEYEEFRNRFLMPYAEEIKRLLHELDATGR
jgi:hypothetical protein